MFLRRETWLACIMSGCMGGIVAWVLTEGQPNRVIGVVGIVAVGLAAAISIATVSVVLDKVIEGE